MDESAQELLARAYTLKDKAQSRALYRDWAATYDRTMLDGLGYITPKETARLLAKYLGDRDAIILDVGAGTGLAGLELAGHGFHHIDALDYSAEMLGVAEARGVYRKTIQADLTEALALDDNSYDAQICTGTFTHAHVGAECLNELARVLRPGGLMACTIHKEVWESAGFAAKLNKMARAGDIELLQQSEGRYYRTSEENEGFYLVWRDLR